MRLPLESRFAMGGSYGLRQTLFSIFHSPVWEKLPLDEDNSLKWEDIFSAFLVDIIDVKAFS